MRICIFNGDMSRGGGTERITSILANTLIKDSIDYEVFVLNLNNETDSSYFPISKSVSFRTLKERGIVKKIIELRKFLRKNRIQVLINVDIMLSIYSIPASLASGTRLVAWEMFNIRNDIGSKHTRMVRQYLLKHCAYYVTQTEGDMNAFKSEMIVRSPITFIHNPVEYDQSYTDYEVNSKILVSAGHFYYTKGYDLAIEVAKYVFQRHADWKWHFYGDGKELEKCKNKVVEYGLERNILFCGRTKNIEAEYKKAALYVMTSRTEGFGLVLTEAKALNLPTIAFDCEFGPREIIENNVNGYLIPAFDVRQMADRICELIENTNKRVNFSEHARDNLYKFSLAMFEKKWIDVINECVGK